MNKEQWFDFLEQKPDKGRKIDVKNSKGILNENCYVLYFGTKVKVYNKIGKEVEVKYWKHSK